MLILLVLFLAIQFIPVKMTNPPTEMEVPANSAIHAILRRTCYHCHSNQTVWPWYARIAPISWVEVAVVAEAREDLNFSTWNRYTPARRRANMQRIWKEIEEGEMPPLLYRTINANGRLSPEDKEILQAWAVEYNQ